MSDDTAAFLLAELQDLVSALVAEDRTLHNSSEARQATTVALRIESQALRDKVVG